MTVFAGDKFVDAEGRDVTNNVEESELVVWPVRVYHAKPEWVSLEFGLYQTTDSYKFEFEASNYEELCDHQISKW